ncbi:glucose-6-phosphate 1-epimerase [Geopseudomonas sagittaria]|uniref:Putative glucose-6-phosphate 1-epimerase n=1 Tax=Geopseudomonas sagittaria TaxID=1135990 RepID=A0A1I5ULJ9_9GAMM|nr:D-hexose-6-phosphate mutarotase [Pseudomonas sagittaria]SFP96102.1 glucose-6-phosphate 1-epimerase [Pseudomonas sagittaria]
MTPAPHISRTQFDALPCWRVLTPQAELLIAEQGAQILRYQRLGEPPLIWLSEQAAGQPGQSVRGGVPVCWPWFGDLARNPAALLAQYCGDAAPFHGLVRNLPWECRESVIDGDEVRLLFVCPQPEDGLPGWPHAVDVELEIRLGTRLYLSLRSHNRGQRPVWLSQALHSYFAVSDIHKVSVAGLDGSRYIETLDGWRECRQAGALQFAGETDRIYLDLPPRLELRDTGWQRRICLESRSSRSAVLWNPWSDKAQRLSQFAADAWQRMLCIETANVLDDCVQLAGGESRSLELYLWSEPLATGV